MVRPFPEGSEVQDLRRLALWALISYLAQPPNAELFPDLIPDIPTDRQHNIVVKSTDSETISQGSKPVSISFLVFNLSQVN